MGFPRSRTGWAFVVAYLTIASVLVYQALTCSGWMCDLVEFPAAIPFGLMYSLLLRLLDPMFGFGSITYAPFRNWFYIVPMLVGNSLIFYWVGVGIARLVAKASRRRSG